MKNSDKFYLTTAIVYASKQPHIGNDYEIIMTDSIARFNRLIGKDVYMLTGTDEHGQKIEELAAASNTTPQSYVDGISGLIIENYKNLNISNDGFIRTSDIKHKEVVKKIFKKLYDKGDIYKGYYEGQYCVPCEAFWTESQLVDGNCPDCGRPVKKTKEEAYFFKMSKYQDKLMKLFNDNPSFILPEFRKNEMINNFLKPGLQDLCVSRTSFEWGIPVGFDAKHIVYVWLDALTNYITAMGYDPDGSSELFKKYWPCDVHIVGKDILRFHSIYWPIILMALDLELPKQIFAHPWMMFAGDKMSKSKGNVLYSNKMIEDFGLDAFRYFMLSEMPWDKDGSVTYETIISRINSDLANTLGNLVNRTVAMVHKYFGGKVVNTKVNEELDKELSGMAVNTVERVVEFMSSYKVSDALESIFALARRSNKYIDETMPWVLGKDEKHFDRLNTVLYNLIETIKFIAVLLKPFMPKTSDDILSQIGAKETKFVDLKKFGVAKEYVCSEAKALFLRIDEAKKIAEFNANNQSENNVKVEKVKMEEIKEFSEISIDEFFKVQLKVAEVVAAEKIEKSDKLLKLSLKVGNESRTVVSGIAKFYTPEEMVGKKVVLVANLKPTKLRGVLSEGMILCASDENGNVVLVQPHKDVESGSEVS